MKKWLWLLVIPLLASCSVSDLLPKALASGTQEVVQQVKTDSTSVYAEIQSNIDMVTNLQQKVQDATANNTMTPKQIDSIIKSLEGVANSYENLAAKRGDIRKGLLDKITKIQQMENQVTAQVKALSDRKQLYTKELNTLNTSAANPDIAKSRQVALTQAIKYVDAQISIWNQFNSIEINIASQLVVVQQQIDSFLSAIDSSAIVFREGLNLLELQRNINNAMSLFTNDLPMMTQLTQDMEKSWSNLDYLVTTLTALAPNISTK